MGTTIYIVTSGDYSDYQIIAVFDSKEKAQAYIDYKSTHVGIDGWHGAFDIEEWGLNEASDAISRGLIRYRVFFADIHQGDADARIEGTGAEQENAGRTPEGRMWYGTHVWTTDQVSALKIANERRVRYLVEHEEWREEWKRQQATNNEEAH